MVKDKCCECGKETTSYVNILTGKDWKYESYCLQCARVFFSFISIKPLGKLSLTQLIQCSYEWDNYVSQNAVKMRDDGVDFNELPSLMKELQKRKSQGNPTTLNKLIKEMAKNAN